MTATMAAIDGRDAVFGFVVKKTPEGGLVAETFGTGLSRADAAKLCRRVADGLDAAAEGEG